MFIETVVFGALVPFFLIVAAFYGWLTEFGEPVGFIGLLLLAGLAGLVAFFLAITARTIDARPEDDPLGTIESAAGEYGEFSPHSWWPFVLGLGAAIVFFGVAVGWWVSGVGAIVGAIGLVGLIFEFSRGQHAH
ncbi:cytochrome C oxidase subunit IV [Serinibacter arcticus]|uniref:Cytochrome c oxidase polypeptide 4 n=2 Tax=Serinibacter arcticus TaxID=1655435 RepID=A0A2U1ZZB0_9MICO|nr:cytochrome C oxidase subunit IV [Serinibacter arcticus]